MSFARYPPIAQTKILRVQTTGHVQSGCAPQYMDLGDMTVAQVISTEGHSQYVPFGDGKWKTYIMAVLTQYV